MHTDLAATDMRYCGSSCSQDHACRCQCLLWNSRLLMYRCRFRLFVHPEHELLPRPACFHHLQVMAGAGELHRHSSNLWLKEDLLHGTSGCTLASRWSE